eukprot:1572335-Rhodomonas_salina.1
MRYTISGIAYAVPGTELAYLPTGAIPTEGMLFRAHTNLVYAPTNRSTAASRATPTTTSSSRHPPLLSPCSSGPENNSLRSLSARTPGPAIDPRP